MAGLSPGLCLQQAEDFWQLDFEVFYSRGGNVCGRPFGPVPSSGGRVHIVRRGENNNEDEGQNGEKQEEGQKKAFDSDNGKFKMTFRVHKEPQVHLRRLMSYSPDEDTYRLFIFVCEDAGEEFKDPNSDLYKFLTAVQTYAPPKHVQHPRPAPPPKFHAVVWVCRPNGFKAEAVVGDDHLLAVYRHGRNHIRHECHSHSNFAVMIEAYSNAPQEEATYLLTKYCKDFRYRIQEEEFETDGLTDDVPDLWALSLRRAREAWHVANEKPSAAEVTKKETAASASGSKEVAEGEKENAGHHQKDENPHPLAATKKRGWRVLQEVFVDPSTAAAAAAAAGVDKNKKADDSKAGGRSKESKAKPKEISKMKFNVPPPLPEETAAATSGTAFVGHVEAPLPRKKLVDVERARNGKGKKEEGDRLLISKARSPNVFMSPMAGRGGLASALYSPDVGMQGGAAALERAQEGLWQLEDFDVGRKLGRGQFGNVYVARERRSGYVFALKTIMKHGMLRTRMEKQLRAEIEIQSHLRHPNVLRMYGYFWDEQRIYLMLEFAPFGELYRIVRDQCPLDERRAAGYLWQVIEGLRYCHSKNVMHRDIKPENVLIGDQNTLKIADFGWSSHSVSKRRKTFCGTLDYLAPELTLNKPYSTETDVWSCGILIYEFLTGLAPFSSRDQDRQFEKIRKNAVWYPDKTTIGARMFINWILQKDQEKRPQLDDLLKHSWLRKYCADGRNEWMGEYRRPLAPIEDDEVIHPDAALKDYPPPPKPPVVKPAVPAPVAAEGKGADCEDEDMGEDFDNDDDDLDEDEEDEDEEEEKSESSCDCGLCDDHDDDDDMGMNEDEDEGEEEDEDGDGEEEGGDGDEVMDGGEG
uniref:Aurora kinase n=1 Tax=Chromera velia CCMP2878 TaxID=1169474 RepID=A0A0G4GZI9_9ALVE|eukprot:Cvel_5452.t1-p1 / transcript=Cvel_5452.t1 / gene=Cvel_5452 / organism=Chromera_velia_CCMP2878 / gene_product=Aurora kinase A, putative / transcript_product=Aurora kinase A, putative / location=Cvel_scaffold254:98546-108485(-) / protein_length=864 / sequence_SO=supercontig / SO=protein_coding / is_pseudo=false